MIAAVGDDGCVRPANTRADSDVSLIKQTKSPVDRSTTKKIENTGDLVASVAVTGRAVTRAQWAVLERGVEAVPVAW